MDKRILQKKLISGLAWAAGISVGMGALAAFLNLFISYAKGFLENGSSLFFGGTLMVILSTSLFVFPLALLFFWVRDYLDYRRNKSAHVSQDERR